MTRWPFLALAVAWCSVAGCNSEVTLRLLTGSAENGGSAADGNTVVEGAGSGGTPAVLDGGGGVMSSGTAGMSGVAGEAGASAGDGGDTPPVPCQKLGAEVCNGGDDNCDGAIDEGCPFTVKWKQDPQGPALGNPAAIAAQFSEYCPSGSLLVGLRVGMGTRLDQVASICRQFELTLDATQTPTTFSFTSATPIMEPIAPATSSKETDTVTEMSCPDGLVVSSLDGTTTTTDPHYTQRIRISCSPPLISNDTLDFDGTKTQVANAITCSGCTASAAYTFHAAVPAGHVASGLFGLDGVWLDLVGVSTSVARISTR